MWIIYFWNFLFVVFGMQSTANIRNDRKCEDQGLVYFISTFRQSTLHSTHQRQMCSKSHALQLEYSHAMVIILLTTPATSSSHRTWNCFSALCNRSLRVKQQPMAFLLWPLRARKLNIHDTQICPAQNSLNRANGLLIFPQSCNEQKSVNVET